MARNHLRGGNPYSNTYNPSWRDHPNLRWGGNQGRDRANPNDHTVCGQCLDRISGEIQSMKTKAKKVQSKCTNSSRTLTKLEDQISQLLSMMGDIKRKIGTCIPNNKENNPWKKVKEQKV
ncbi:hypothetical protein V6Z11_D04G099300 [Gossypium hirsutum]